MHVKLYLFGISFFLISCEQAVEAEQYAPIAAEKEIQLPVSTLTSPDIDLQKEILGKSPNLKRYSRLTKSIAKLNSAESSKIEKIDWNDGLLKVSARVNGGTVFYKKTVICTENQGFLWSCSRSYKKDQRLSIRKRGGDTDTIISHVEGYPREYTKVDSAGNSSTHTRDEVEFVRQSYKSAPVSVFVFKNVARSTLRHFDIYENGCNQNDDNELDFCNVRIPFFDQELSESGVIKKYLEGAALDKISVEALGDLYSKYSKYYSSKEIIARNILDRLVQTNSIEKIVGFIDSYSSHDDLCEEAKSKVFELVRLRDTVSGYEWFIEKYSKSKYSLDAINIIHEKMFDAAKKINTISSYNSFIFTYPTASQVLEANELAFKLERRKFAPVKTFFGFGETSNESIERQSRKLLIIAKTVERIPRDAEINGTDAMGYFIVANRMYGLLQADFDFAEATLRHLESQEFKDFTMEFREGLQSIESQLSRIEANTLESNKYARKMISISNSGFSNAKIDRGLAEYKADQHRNWEKLMSSQ